MNNIRVSVPLPDLIRAIIIALEHLGIEVSDPDANEGKQHLYLYHYNYHPISQTSFKGAQLAAARVANQPPEFESSEFVNQFKFSIKIMPSRFGPYCA